MKRSNKTTKLLLDREAVRNLVPDQLAKVQGGAPNPTSGRPTCQSCVTW